MTGSSISICGELEASLPAHDLVLGGGAPQYDREFKEPAPT